MNRLSVSLRQRVMAACCTFALALTACTEDVADDNSLPDGRYPMTFTTTVQGLTQTRATVDNTWAGTEEVAVMAGNTVKKYMAANGGELTPADTDNPHYWTSKTMTVQAWYSATYSDTRPEKFTVQPGQNNGTGYQQSDMLYAIASVSYSGGSSASLEFKHLPAKVVVNLKADTQNGITEADVTNATVTLVNQALTSGTITVDEDGKTYTVAQAVSGSDGITPQKSGQTVSGYQQTVQALVVPQQMQGRKFIKVTTGAGTAARDYYYTPTTEVDGKLEAGYQYTYNITVKKEKLEVTASSSVSWKNDMTTGNAQEATFRINYEDGMTLTAGDDKGTLREDGAGVKVLSGGNLLKVTLKKREGKFLKDVLASSIYCTRQSWKSVDNGYEVTYQLKSDVTLTSLFVDKPTLEIGSYYYDDGEWSTEWWDRPCIGIVFKVGRDKYDQNTYKNLNGEVQGYVVALQDAPGERKDFGSSADISSFTTSTTDFKGYTACQDMSGQKGFSIGTHWACYSALHYTPEAPAASSGWYLPSLGEWNVLWQNFGKVKEKFATAGGSKMDQPWGFYWSMSRKDGEYSYDRPAVVDFGVWSNSTNFSDVIKNHVGVYYSRTRPIFTF